MTRAQTRDGAVRATTLAVTGGKGGVGKTSVTVNLAVALARLRRRVTVLDADVSLGNIDVQLGLAPSRHLGHVLSGERTVREVVMDGPLGIQIVPAPSGLAALSALTAPQWQRLHAAIETLKAETDFLLIDTAPGISGNVTELLPLTDRAVVVTSLEPTAIVDAYALIKVLTGARHQPELGVLVNAARDADEASLVFQQLDMAAERFLKRRLSYYGFVEYDPAVRESVLVQRPIVDHLPQSPASRSFRILASKLSSHGPSGGRALHLVVPAASGQADSTQVEAPRCA